MYVVGTISIGQPFGAISYLIYYEVLFVSGSLIRMCRIVIQVGYLNKTNVVMFNLIHASVVFRSKLYHWADTMANSRPVSTRTPGTVQMPVGIKHIAGLL
jgi:hypothetical protein